jgi:hypothetical protein
MSEQGTTKDQVCEHDFLCLECGASLDELHQPIGWMTEGGEAFIEHRLKLERPEDFVRFTIPVPRVPVAANEDPTDPVPSKEQLPEGWISLSQGFGWIADRLMVKTPEFVINNWGCKYIDARIDMRTGRMQLSPGNARPAPEPPAGQYTIEPHGDVHVLYRGRDDMHHGYNLARITETDEGTLQLIERALNASAQPPGDGWDANGSPVGGA